MKTYLTVFFNSEGERPSEVASTLYNLGFNAVQGNYDFEYDWGTNASIEDVIYFADKIQTALKEYGVMFKVESVI